MTIFNNISGYVRDLGLKVLKGLKVSKIAINLCTIHFSGDSVIIGSLADITHT